MTLPNSSPRKQLHTRTITCKGYLREDGLWEVEGHLVDTKTYSFENRWRGTINPGTPIHGIRLRLTTNNQLVVQDCIAVIEFSPFANCKAITERYEKLIGKQIKPGWTRTVKTLLAGTKGCAHLTELLGPISTTLFQTMATMKKDSEAQKTASKPFYLDGCHMWARNGEQVLEFHPEYHTHEAKKQPIPARSPASSNAT